jgi:hypothetical protein
MAEAAGVTVIQCARREGYVTDRLQTLLVIVNAAIEAGGSISYA